MACSFGINTYSLHSERTFTWTLHTSRITTPFTYSLRVQAKEKAIFSVATILTSCQSDTFSVLLKDDMQTDWLSSVLMKVWKMKDVFFLCMHLCKGPDITNSAHFFSMVSQSGKWFIQPDTDYPLCSLGYGLSEVILVPCSNKAHFTNCH